MTYDVAVLLLSSHIRKKNLLVRNVNSALQKKTEEFWKELVAVMDSAAMEKRPELGASASLSPSTGIGSRFSNLNKSFKYSLRPMLTSCSKEELYKVFSSFSNTEKEVLHRLFLQVITSLHENIEDRFKTVCLETQAGATLDAIEEIVEAQDLDPLFSKRSNIMDVAENLSTAKKHEIQHLKHLVQLGEEHNQMLHTRLRLLREDSQVLSGASKAVEKVRSFLNLYKSFLWSKNYNFDV
ncbi:hypothetical protein RJT34_09996 [Clitoria ternatea]|uniref:Uncharacterized protein n=1 Tax=Clitoria ternatea TaxID=43366 RepID=A0AAN9K7J6_CLITE